jgi:N6-adenosine-specific RNA methylase IME4
MRKSKGAHYRAPDLQRERLMREYEVHPYALLFPLMGKQDFDALAEDMRANGMRDPITLYDGKILDGRNRYRACGNLGIEPHFDTFEGEEAGALSFVISKNLARRHLNESQRAMVAESLANMRQGERTDMEPCLNSSKVSQEEAAKKLNVSRASVQAARKVKQKAAPEVRKAVEEGKLSLNAAAKIAELPKDDQKKVMQHDRPDQAVKKLSREINEQELAAKQTALPNKRYGVILADPEWSFEPYSRETGMDRAADNHYPTSATDQICERDVGSIAADDAVLFLWATVPMLPDALRVMEAWGFKYKSHAVWAKDRIGTGYWFRNQHELLLVGTRGKIPAPAMGTQWPSLIDAPVGRHSEKPIKSYELIEHYFPTLPKIELNARNRRDGWDAWGNEAGAEAAE